MTPAMKTALAAIRADAKEKGCCTDLVHGAEGTSLATLRALRDRGYIRFDNLRSGSYQTQGMFGRGHGRTRYYTSYTITLLKGE
jgi:hypothetical protein